MLDGKRSNQNDSQFLAYGYAGRIYCESIKVNSLEITNLYKQPAINDSGHNNALTKRR